MNVFRRVIAQVSAEIVKPQPDRPYEGFLTLNTEIGPMASSAFEAGRQVDSFSLSTHPPFKRRADSW